jgi:hypothetical protein
MGSMVEYAHEGLQDHLSIHRTQPASLNRGGGRWETDADWDLSLRVADETYMHTRLVAQQANQTIGKVLPLSANTWR